MSSSLSEAHDLISLLLGQTGDEKKHENLSLVLQNKVAEYCAKVGTNLGSEAGDVGFNFVRCSVHALINLRSQLKLAVEQNNVSGGPPPDTLSMTQTKASGDLLGMVVALGVLPNLLPGVGLPLEERSDKLINAASLSSSNSVLEKYKQLVFTLESLLELKSCRSLSTIIMTRYIGDLLCALVQVTSAPLMKPNVDEGAADQSNDSQKDIEVKEETFVMTQELYERLTNDQIRFKVELDKIVTKTYQPLIVKNLLILHSKSSSKGPKIKRPPKWFVNTIGMMLSERLLAGDDGIMQVVRGVLDLGGNQTKDWSKVNMIADVIGNPPKSSGQYSDTETYYSKICPQLLNMIDDQNESTVQMIASASIRTITERSLILSRRHLLGPLMSSIVQLESKLATDVTEDQLDVSIKNIFKVFVLGNDPSLMFMSHLEPIMLILMNLHLAITFGVSHLRDPIKQIIERYLKHSDSATSLSMLRAFALDELPVTRQNRAKMMNPDVTFANGEEGGVRIINKMDSEQSFYVSDDERAIVVQDLLSDVVKDRKLTVEFFLSLMEDLNTAMTEDDVFDGGNDVELPISVPGQDIEQQLLDMEKQLDNTMHQMRRSLMVIRLLGLLSEDDNFQENILKESDKMIQFVSAGIKRAATAVRNGKDTSTMGIQSLNMSLSILSVHLTQENVGVSDWEKMQDVVPDLEILSGHKDERISKISSQLHKLVLTHGVILDEIKELKEKTNNIKDKTAQMKEQAKEVKHLRKVEEDKQLDAKKAQIKNKAEELKKQKELRKSKGKDSEKSKYESALFDISDPFVPVQGHGLISLAKLVEEKDEETLNNLDKVRLLFQSNLEDTDTYIYLSAINGLVACASHKPDLVLDALVREFNLASERKMETTEGGNQEDATMQLRTKVGEALVQITKQLGDFTPQYKNVLLNAFFSVANDPDPLVRASGLSNLGEVVKNLRFSLGGVEGETLLHLANSSRDKDPGVRAAAALVLTMVLQGLGTDAFRVLDSCMRDVYRELKLLCSTEQDETVKVHLGLALEEVDNIVKTFLTPNTAVEKKIYVLDPPPDAF